jgi:hypothetical protein
MSQNTYYRPGRYKCRITSQGFIEASTGTAQFYMKFQVLESIEPFNDALVEHERTIYFPITTKTADRTLHDLCGVGYPGDSFEALDPQSENCYSFVGRELELGCSHETDLNGNAREKWSLRATPQPLSNDRIRDLGRFLTKPKPPLRTSSRAGAGDAALTITDDDVPF